MKGKIELPDKYSDVILLALEDMKVISKNPNYELDMMEWHTADTDKCYVCLAGCVITNTFKESNKLNIALVRYSSFVSDKLLSLDEFRNGNIREGLLYYLTDDDELDLLEKDNKVNELESIIDEYQGEIDNDNVDEFIKDATKVAIRLKELGY